jgi:hypothetical protein
VHIEKFTTWALAIGVSIILAASYLIDGPSEADLDQAQAADLADAQAQAQHIARLTRECHKLRGPSAELLQIRDTDDYVCRTGEVEPVPAEVLHRYASLGAPRQ